MPSPVRELIGMAVVVAALATVWLIGAAPWWLRARRAGIRLGWVEIIAMRIRKVSLWPVIGALAAAKEAGLDVFIGRIETHVLAGGDPEAAIAAFVEAGRRGDEVDLEEVFGLDLAGVDVVAHARAGTPMRGMLGSERSAHYDSEGAGLVRLESSDD